MFYEQVELFRRGTEAQAQRICKAFVYDGSPSEVNITSQQRNDLIAAISKKGAVTSDIFGQRRVPPPSSFSPPSFYSTRTLTRPQTRRSTRSSASWRTIYFRDISKAPYAEGSCTAASTTNLEISSKRASSRRSLVPRRPQPAKTTNPIP